MHQPFEPAARDSNLYVEQPVPPFADPRERANDKAGWARNPPTAGREETILRYRQTLAAVDSSLGRILEELERQDILDETVVIYAGDNGYLMGEHGGMWDKRAAFDPSIRIPLLMRYPRLFPRSTVCAEAVLNIDLAPTVLDLAGAPAPEGMQGESWLDLPGGAPGRESFLYEYFAEHGEVPTCLAVRTREWKYVVYPHDPRHEEELYHLKYDPGEVFNRAGEANYDEALDRMRDELRRLQAETGFVYPPGCGPPE